MPANRRRIRSGHRRCDEIQARGRRLRAGIDADEMANTVFMPPSRVRRSWPAARRGHIRAEQHPGGGSARGCRPPRRHQAACAAFRAGRKAVQIFQSDLRHRPRPLRAAHHSVKVVSTNRFAGLSPRRRRRSLTDFPASKFTFALRRKSSAVSLRPMRLSKHPTQRKRHSPSR